MIGIEVSFTIQQLYWMSALSDQLKQLGSQYDNKGATAALVGSACKVMDYVVGDVFGNTEGMWGDTDLWTVADPQRGGDHE